MTSAVLPRRLIGAVLLLALPSLAVLLGLVVFAGLAFGDALIAAVLLMVGLALLLGAHLRHLARLTDYAAGMAAGRAARPPGVAPAPPASTTGSRRAWSRRCAAGGNARPASPPMPRWPTASWT